MNRSASLHPSCHHLYPESACINILTGYCNSLIPNIPTCCLTTTHLHPAANGLSKSKSVPSTLQWLSIALNIDSLAWPPGSAHPFSAPFPTTPLHLISIQMHKDPSSLFPPCLCVCCCVSGSPALPPLAWLTHISQLNIDTSPSWKFPSPTSMS